jgi:hypothetical protein
MSALPEVVFPFGLPFNAAEFHNICAEVNYTRMESIGQGYPGSITLFIRMLNDLILMKVNMKDFPADKVPATMETNQTLLEVLARTQGDQTQDYVLNYAKVMSHLQAAAFA